MHLSLPRGNGVRCHESCVMSHEKTVVIHLISAYFNFQSNTDFKFEGRLLWTLLSWKGHNYWQDKLVNTTRTPRQLGFSWKWMYFNQFCQLPSKYPEIEWLRQRTCREFQYPKILRAQLSAHEAMQIFCNTEGITTGHEPFKTSKVGDGMTTDCKNCRNLFGKRTCFKASYSVLF